MGRRKKAETEGTSGEQLELIDVGPENMKAIKPVARKYKAALKARLAALEEETKFKQQLLGLIKEQKLSRLPDGKIRFKCDGMTVTVTPRDELVRVKEDDDEQGEDAEE